MVSGGSDEELPPGWKEHVKYANGRKIKYYTHEERGLKLYSKKRVICCDKMQPCQGTLMSLNEQKEKSDTSESEVVVEKDVSPEWLPTGWIVESRTRQNGLSAGSIYKIYVDPTTGYKFYSKPQVMRYLRSVNSTSPPEKQNQDQEVSGGKSSKEDAPQNSEPTEDKSTLSGDSNDTGKLSLEVVNRSAVLDDLPPGWVKEIRARSSDRRRKDPFYIDPVNGYEFRSKKDVQRYLETGGIESCIMKPKKSQLKVEDAICVSAKTDCLKLDPMATDDHGAVSSPATALLDNLKQPKAERSKETGTHYISADPKSTTADEKEGKKLYSEENGCDGSEHCCETKMEGAKSSVKFNDNGAVSGTKSPVLHEQTHPKDHLDAKTPTELKKSRKRKSLSVPARSSKRLSGQEPEILPMIVASERAFRAAVKKSAQKEVNVSIVENKAAANESPEQLDTNQQKKIATDVLVASKVASTETETINNIEKPALVQGIPEQAAEHIEERQEEGNPRSQDSHVWYPFGDSLSDPCYEFAFKTLTGEIPLEDTLAFQNLFQQPIEVPPTQGVVSVGLPEIDTTSLFQNDAPFQLDSIQNKAPPDQLPSNSSIQSANINLASCTGFNCQQPSLGTRSKDCETRVNS